MKLNKMKVARLTSAQAKAVQGGYTDDSSTRHNFTCGWCTSSTSGNGNTCKSTDNNGQNTCYHC